MKEWFIFLGGLLLLGLAASLVIANPVGGSPPQQPIDFNHKKHSPFLTCASCHKGAENYAAARIPGKDFCWSCHQGGVSASPEAAKLKDYVEQGKEIPWLRYFHLNTDIVYSHKDHIQAGILCSTCHGDIAQKERITQGFGRLGSGGPYGRQLMDFCLACHRKSAANTDCLACHK